MNDLTKAKMGCCGVVWCNHRAGSAAALIIAMLVAIVLLFAVLKYSKGPSDECEVQETDAGMYRSVQHLDEAGVVGLSAETRSRRLSNFALDADDNIVACDQADQAVRVISADDKLKRSWKLNFPPQALAVRDDGAIIVGGPGKIALLNDGQETINECDLPGTSCTSIAITGNDVFVTVRMQTRYTVYRMNRQFGEQTQIIDGLRGCCGQMDIKARNGHVYVAENARHKVRKYDREGKELSSFGEKVRGSQGQGFSGCCEPKNICFDKQGNIYTAESSGRCVKKFSPEGKFLEHVGTVQGITGCVRVTCAVTKDGSKIYMLDTSNNVVRLVK